MGETTLREDDRTDDQDAATAFMQESVPILAAMGMQVLSGSPSGASVLLPHAPNSNHVGTTYAGSLLSSAEVLGGLVGFAQGLAGFVPIVSRIEIDYLKPATTDVTASTAFCDAEQARVRADAEQDGKARFVLDIVLHDDAGVEVARAVGHYQLRRFG